MGDFDRIRVSGAIEGDYVVLKHRSGNVLRIAPVPAGGLPIVTSLKRTCIACPAQWEGTLDDGRALYVRYRWGGLSVGIGEDIDDAIENRWGDKALFEEDVGEGLDGYMDLPELKDHLRGLLDFAEGLDAEGEDDWKINPEAFAKIFGSKKSDDAAPTDSSAS